MSDVVFEIKKHIGVLHKYPNGWQKELNIVVWNGAEPKYDIRDWNPEHSVMTRGITLSADEMITLVASLRKECEGEHEDN